MEAIAKLYNDPATGLVSFTAFWKKNRDELKRERITKREVREYFEDKVVTGVRKLPIGRPHIITPIYHYQADLMFDGNVTVLCIISVRSRFAYAYVLKNKSAPEVTRGFQEFLLASIRKGTPATVWTDMGKEFVNETFHKLLAKDKIEHIIIPPEDHDRLGIVERFIRSLRHRIDLYSKSDWPDKLQSFIDGYNSTVHSVTGLAPKDTPENTAPPAEWVAHNLAIAQAIKTNYTPGTQVRLLEEKEQWEKGTREYSKDVYEVVKQNKYTIMIRRVNTNDAPRKVTIDLVKRLTRVYAISELGKPELYEAEAIVDHKISKSGRVKYRVRWAGYAEEDDTWEPVDNVRLHGKLSPLEKAYLKKTPDKKLEAALEAYAR